MNKSSNIQMVIPLIHEMKRRFLQAGFILALVVFLVPPVSARIHVVGGLTRQMKLSPGEEAQGRIIVHNSAGEDCVARAYLADYLSFADGTVRYDEPGTLPRSNAAWVHIIPRERVVSAGEDASFHFIVRVPETDTLAGTYWCMLMVEPLAPDVLTPPSGRRKPLAALRIRAVTRTGIHLATHIGDTGLRAMGFTAKKLVRRNGENILSLDMENTGERQLGLRVWAELFDLQGVSIGRFHAGRRGLYPGASARLRIPLEGVPPGKYHALVIADNGDEHVFGARYNLQVPGSRPAPGALP
jgi:hypothetical protein